MVAQLRLATCYSEGEYGAGRHAIPIIPYGALRKTARLE